ncbi:MAG: M15 family metallopeptidase [Desulfovibrio sp.]|nr:M15 family metallopeptidase [Desulfovibrio sp.]
MADNSAPTAPADGIRREISAARILVKAYPDIDLILERDSTGLYLRAGQERLFFSPDSGCPPPSPLAEEDQPLCASLSQTYPRGQRGRDAPAGFEPGRVRNEALFRILYGKNAEEVQKNCVPVPFMDATVPFNKRHGAADALERVGKKLKDLVRREPALREYILPLEGTFLWRTIEGTGRLSAHAFAVAIDLNAKAGPYWRWAKSAAAAQNARSRYPQAIVDAFESEGFIWGGKWHSFDFMHFEYRPELLPDNCAPR